MKGERWNSETDSCKVNQKLTTKLQVTTRNSHFVGGCNWYSHSLLMIFRSTLGPWYIKPLRQQATPRPCGFTVQQRISWCWGACCKWWVALGVPFVPLGAFPSCLKCWTNKKSVLLNRIPNSFIVCKCLFSCLSCFWLTSWRMVYLL